MDFLKTLKISASGLSAQRQRLNVIASNLANIETTRTEKGGPYKKKSVVFTAKPVSEFDKVLGSKLHNRGSIVEVSAIIEDDKPPKMVYKPDHPDANEKGFIALPNIVLMEEMVDMITTTRSYDANATVIAASKSMAMKAIEIGNK